MQFELTFEWNIVPPFREAKIDPAAYREFSNLFDHQQGKLPQSITCLCTLGDMPASVRLTVFSTMPWARIQFEVDDPMLGKHIREKLVKFSTEDESGRVYKGWKTREITKQILKRAGLTMNDIESRKGVISGRCIDALRRHYDETEPDYRRDISWLFTSDSVPRPDQPRVARWLVKHLVLTKGWPEDSHIVEQLYNELAVPEIADDLIRLLKDRSYKGRDGCLFDVFVKTRDRRVLDVAVSVLDDRKLTQRALACIGRRKAKQHIEKVRQFLKHPNFEIRREARKAMKQLGFPMEAPPPPVHLARKSLMPRKLEEWSANLDAEEVSPILEKLARRVERGFGAKEIAEVNGVLEDMKEEQTRAFRFPITVKGKKAELWLVIFMDDVDSPDLEIHSSPELVQELSGLLPDED